MHDCFFVVRFLVLILLTNVLVEESGCTQDITWNVPHDCVFFFFFSFCFVDAAGDTASQFVAGDLYVFFLYSTAVGLPSLCCFFPHSVPCVMNNKKKKIKKIKNYHPSENRLLHQVICSTNFLHHFFFFFPPPPPIFFFKFYSQDTTRRMR